MIDKILNTKNINYSSNLNGDNLRQKIEDRYFTLNDSPLKNIIKYRL